MDRFLIENGLKFDNLEIRKDLETFNAALFIVFAGYILDFFGLLAITYSIFAIFVSLVVSLMFIYSSLIFLLYLVKYDFIFSGQIIRDSEWIAKKLFSK